MKSEFFHGVALALLASCIYGLYMSPRKHSSLDDQQYPATMGIGIFLTLTLGGALFAHRLLLPKNEYLLCLLGGLFWGLGTCGYAASVRLIGLSRATPIKDSSGVLGVLAGAILFAEIPVLLRPLHFSSAVVGSAIIVGAAMLLQTTLIPATEAERRYKWLGIALAAAACFLHAAYTVPLRAVESRGFPAPQLMPALGQGCLLSMFLPLLIASRNLPNWLRQPWLSHGQAALSGLLWGSATIILWIAISKSGLAVPWGLANLNSVVAIIYGIVIFKEIKIGQHPREVALGLLGAILGTILLTISRAFITPNS